MLLAECSGGFAPLAILEDNSTDRSNLVSLMRACIAAWESNDSKGCYSLVRLCGDSVPL